MNEQRKVEKLLIRFRLHLEDRSLHELERPKGPLFHRWLPNGLDDAIKVGVDSKGSLLSLYFERCGVVRDGFIYYVDGHLICDDEIIQRQAWIDGGPLCGILELFGCSGQEIESVICNNSDNVAYISLAKRIVKLVSPCFDKIITVITRVYGQYWVKQFEWWDSRSQSIGNYCHFYLHMEWSTDGGVNWSRFRPENNLTQSVTVRINNDEEFKRYLTKEDWCSISSIFSSGFENNVGHAFLLRANKLFSAGEISQGIVEGVIALEVAVNEFVCKHTLPLGEKKKAMKSFESLSLTTKVAAVMTLSGKFSGSIVEVVINVIEIRNKIVHEAYIKENIDDNIIFEFLGAVAALLDLDNAKFPRVTVQNKIFAS